MPALSGRSAPSALLVLLLIGACASSPEPPPPPTAVGGVEYQEGEPGLAAVATVEVSARVVGVDRETRTVTLLGSEGEELEIVVGPEVVNFDQIDVGDLVTATLTEELVVSMGDPDAARGDGEASAVALPPVGAKPAGVMADTVQVTGTVTAIDPDAHTATLRFPDGSTDTFQVRADVDLGRRSVGEQVVFQVTRSVAIEVRTD